ncbi:MULTISPECIES: DUF1002 domain-containing protein [Enterococcus]|uniref:Extracellular protein n=1 Tax=Enterococcus sulfureus ATCC 49903 TaxID=1140003 RepID=S0LD16_9ENTE|nr:DUF1002 domain-containing protein [Enterococcus sulfureus]EOT49436.1 hypothetical protein OMY_00364 [Enterococcus sulfureus ATCC 49903]EOT87303.1 hypothetical protein I573_00359 [Enterococcus sulfureus ATCC 49903]
MKRQIMITMATAVLLTTQVTTMAPQVLAQETATSTTTTSEASGMERLQINAVAIGNALTSEQETYTLDKLGIKGETPIYKTTGADLVKYLPGNGFTDQWAVYSSVRMQTADKNDGITVDIATPENITKITAAQYQNAALTAGISDAKLTIASAVPIDGSGALAGVYKIVEESGGIIDQKRVEVAQDEMEVLATITEQNKDKAGYSDEALNKAQEEAKTTLAEQTAKGENLTQADIKQAVEDALANNGLKDIITSDQLNELTSVVDSMKENNILSDFVNQLDLSNAKQQIEEKSKGLWTKIKDFFSGIWSSITGMFGGNDEQPTEESIVQ